MTESLIDLVKGLVVAMAVIERVLVTEVVSETEVV